MSELGKVVQNIQALVAPTADKLTHWALSLTPAFAALVVVLSLVAAVIGARRPVVRLVAAVVGMLLGFAYAARFEPWLEFLHLPSRQLTYGLGGAFAVFGGLLPEGITFAIGGLLCATPIASFFASDDRAYAFIPAFLVGGAAGVMMFPLVAALVSSFGGGMVCAAALVALLPKATLGGYLAVHPVATAGLGLAIGLAGFLGQLRAGHDEPSAADDGADAPPEGSPPSEAPRKKPARAKRRKATKAKARAEP